MVAGYMAVVQGDDRSGRQLGYGDGVLGVADGQDDIARADAGAVVGGRADFDDGVACATHDTAVEFIQRIGIQPVTVFRIGYVVDTPGAVGG